MGKFGDRKKGGSGRSSGKSRSSGRGGGRGRSSGRNTDSSGKFRSSGRSGGRSSGRSAGRSVGGRSGGRDRGREQLTMHKVICDKCKAKCEVPFLPNENKPVYCSDCFRSEGPLEKQSPAMRASSAGGEVSRKELDEINKKLDKILAILEDL